MEHETSGFGMWVLTLIVGMVAGLMAGVTIQQDVWRKDAVLRGFAEYSPQTGKWQWLELRELQERYINDKAGKDGE